MQELGWCDGVKRWPAPAKLNLFLHITGRRDDGYHQLQTVFQLLDYGDELSFSKRDDQKLTLTIDPHDDALAGEDNLVLRAAKKLRQLAPQTNSVLPGVDICLYKKLPAGAGLGGGSSDAATTLVALNHLWRLRLTVDELAQAGAELGADIPVFVRAESAWAEGIGDQLRSIDLPQKWFVVLNPAVHVGTAELFGHPQLTRDCTPITIRAFHSGESTTNVFESLVCELQPKVRCALNELRVEAREHGASEPRMTGTGSSVFLACETQSGAQKVLEAVTGRVQGLSGFVAGGIEQSELLHYT